MQVDYSRIFNLIKTEKNVPLPEDWIKNEDVNPNYMGGFLTASNYYKSKIAEALHQIHEGKEGNAIQILNHLAE